MIVKEVDAPIRFGSMEGKSMDDKIKNKEQGLKPEEKAEELKQEIREIPDEMLENIAGGSTPIISPYR